MRKRRDLRLAEPRDPRLWQVTAWLSGLLLGCSASDVSPASDGLAIVGGEPAGWEQMQSTVAITDVDGNVQCSGTLIEPTTVLSAAHCFVFESEQVVMPARDFWVSAGGLQVDPTHVALVAVRSIRVHAGFRGLVERAGGALRTAELPVNDLALLGLETPVEGIEPTPPLPSARLDSVVQGTPLFIAGFGEGQRGETGLLNVATSPFQSRTATEFVVGGVGLPDTCYGDSGGPAYLTLDGSRFLLGASARGASNTGECGLGGIFTLVPAYEEWLRADAVDDLRPAGGEGCSISTSSVQPSDAGYPSLLVAAAAIGWARRRRALRRIRT